MKSIRVGIYFLSFVMLSDFCDAQQTQKADIPSPAQVNAAVSDLKNSKNPATWVAAVEVVSQSSDKDAQQALRTFLVDPDVLAAISDSKVWSFDSPTPHGLAFPEYTAIMKSVASGVDGQETLLWLLPQKRLPTQKPIDHQKTGPIPNEVGPELLLESFQYVPEPREKLLAFCASTLGDTKTSHGHQDYLLNALAAWGTDESLKLYQKHALSSEDTEFLVLHRDKIGTLTVLMQRLKAMDASRASPYVDELCRDVSMNREISSLIPDFAHDSKSAIAAADVLDDFLKDSGKASPTAKQRDAIGAIVTRLRARASQ